MHPSARRPLYYYINKKKPGKPARKTRKFGAKNWLLYTNAKKAQKTLKKGLPNPLECGTICERQALRQKNDFRSLSTKPLKRTNRRSKTPADTEMLRMIQVQNVQKPRKKSLTKNRFCGKIIKSSAAKAAAHRTLKIEQYRKTCNGTYFRVGKTR